MGTYFNNPYLKTKPVMSEKPRWEQITVCHEEQLLMPAVSPLEPRTFEALQEALLSLKGVAYELATLLNYKMANQQKGLFVSYRKSMFKKVHRILYDLDHVFGANVLALRTC